MPTQEIDPTVVVIFGGRGDLTWRKLVPAFYNLFVDGWPPDQFAIIGVDRREMSNDEYAAHLHDGVQQFSRYGQATESAWTDFADQLHYMRGDFNDPDTFSRLASEISAKAKAWDQQPDQVFYLAIPPGVIERVVRGLGSADLAADRDRTRVVVEKPFGRDEDSARSLNKMLTEVFFESQVYRIDHYLGKETVQNILAFRFANALFEPIWDSRYIRSVQITVAESVGVGHRGEYYDQAGAVRDMIQSHLLQILGLVAMEPPVSFAADEIRNKKLDVLQAIREIPRSKVSDIAVRGQYEAGEIDGETVAAYRDESGVDSDSTTETFAALKLFVDNWRWQGVPFYLRTGKRLSKKVSTVAIEFWPVPHRAFPDSAAPQWQPNQLVIHIQPNESIEICLQVKQPGPTMRLGQVDMHFQYEEAFQEKPIPEAYETLLLDLVQRDATLFMRADQIETAWRIVDPILEAWADSGDDLIRYKAGTWGPAAAHELLRDQNRKWQLGCGET